MVRRLPAEVLQEIFQHLAIGEYLYDMDDGPWVLCRVCKPWRRVALSDTRLWAGSNLNIDRTDGLKRLSLVGGRARIAEYGRLRKRILSTVLERTGTRGFGFEYTVEDISGILELLLQRSMQWTRANLFFGHSRDFEHLQPVHSHLPILHELVFSIDDPGPGEEDPVDIARVTAFADCPMLKTLTLDDSGPLEPFPLTRLTLPYTQIQNCVYSNLNQNCEEATASIVVIFTILQHLQSFKAISDSGPSIHPIFHPSERVVATSLTTLSTSNIRLLLSLELPNLASLTIFAVNEFRTPGLIHHDLEDLNTGRDILPAVLHLLSVSGCSLTRLSLTDSHFAAIETEQLFELTPGLSELSIQFRFFRDSRLRLESLRVLFGTLDSPNHDAGWTSSRDDGCDRPDCRRFRFLPSLKKFVFSDKEVGHLDSNKHSLWPLLSILRRKREDGGILEEVHISTSAFQQLTPPIVVRRKVEDSREEIVRLQESGVRVSIEGDFLENEEGYKYAPQGRLNI